MTSLGERLKAQNAERARRAAEEAARKVAKREEAEREERRKIENFFERIRLAIVADIDVGNPVRQQRLKPYAPYVIDQKLPSDPVHKYYDVWQKFAVWLADNGLAAELVYGHDGVGMDSWYDVKIIPAE